MRRSENAQVKPGDFKWILIINRHYQTVQASWTQTVSPPGEWSDFSLFYLESRLSAALLFWHASKPPYLPVKARLAAPLAIGENLFQNKNIRIGLPLLVGINLSLIIALRISIIKIMFKSMRAAMELFATSRHCLIVIALAG